MSAFHYLCNDILFLIGSHVKQIHDKQAKDYHIKRYQKIFDRYKTIRGKNRELSQEEMNYLGYLKEIHIYGMLRMFYKSPINHIQIKKINRIYQWDNFIMSYKEWVWWKKFINNYKYSEWTKRQQWNYFKLITDLGYNYNHTITPISPSFDIS